MIVHQFRRAPADHLINSGRRFPWTKPFASSSDNSSGSADPTKKAKSSAALNTAPASLHTLSAIEPAMAVRSSSGGENPRSQRLDYWGAAEDRRTQSHLDAWVQLWRDAPTVVKEDVFYLIAATPSLIIVWLAIWFATPA